MLKDSALVSGSDANHDREVENVETLVIGAGPVSGSFPLSANAS